MIKGLHGLFFFPQNVEKYRVENEKNLGKMRESCLRFL